MFKERRNENNCSLISCTVSAWMKTRRQTLLQTLYKHLYVNSIFRLLSLIELLSNSIYEQTCFYCLWNYFPSSTQTRKNLLRPTYPYWSRLAPRERIARTMILFYSFACALLFNCFVLSIHFNLIIAQLISELRQLSTNCWHFSCSGISRLAVISSQRFFSLSHLIFTHSRLDGGHEKFR